MEICHVCEDPTEAFGNCPLCGLATCTDCVDECTHCAQLACAECIDYGICTECNEAISEEDPFDES